MAEKKIQLDSETINQVRAYRRALKSAQIPIEKMIVFGSRAKGTAKSYSDIDVAVVSAKFGKNYFREGVRLMHLRKNLLLIEPHPFNPNDLNDRYFSLANEVRKYGIVVD